MLKKELTKVYGQFCVNYINKKFFNFFEMSRVTYEDAMSELAIMFPGLTNELLDTVLRQNSIIPFRNYSGTT